MMYRSKQELEGTAMEVLRFVGKYCDENGWAPSYREIGDATGVSLGQVKSYLLMLERDRLVRLGGGARMIAMTERGMDAARKPVQ